jgi:hypothetical protein
MFSALVFPHTSADKSSALVFSRTSADKSFALVFPQTSADKSSALVGSYTNIGQIFHAYSTANFWNKMDSACWPSTSADLILSILYDGNATFSVLTTGM